MVISFENASLVMPPAAGGVGFNRREREERMHLCAHINGTFILNKRTGLEVQLNLANFRKAGGFGETTDEEVAKAAMIDQQAHFPGSDIYKDGDELELVRYSAIQLREVL